MAKKFVPPTKPWRNKGSKPKTSASLLNAAASSTAGSLISADDYKPTAADEYCLDTKVDFYDPRFDSDVGAHLRRCASIKNPPGWADVAAEWLVKTDKEKYHYSEMPEEMGDMAQMAANPSFIRECAKRGRVYYIGPNGYLRRHILKGKPVVSEMIVEPDKVDPGFFLRPDWMEDLEGFIKRGETVLLIGPSGCGKTETCERIFAENEVMLHIVDCNPSMCADDLEGKTELVATPTGTETKFHLAAPALAARDGHGVLFNEADTLQAEAAFALYSLLNRKPMNILRHAQIPIHNQFRALGTQNTEGRGDTAGLFHGRIMQDESFLDRWDQFILVDYPSVPDEVKILQATTGIPKEHATQIAETAVTLRNSTKQGLLMMSVGLRRTKKVAANIVAGYDYEAAWKFAVMNRATSESRATIEEALQRHYGKKKGKK